MNLIYVHTHDSGRYMQPYGIGTDNPNFMRLARESFMFHQAHCTAPTCSCSRVGMLSGMAPHSSGMFGLAHRGFHMNDYHKHLSHYLHDHGYYTVLSGVQHEAKDDSVLGYDERFTKRSPSSRERDLASLEYALDFLRSGRNGDKPFFLAFGMYSTHLVYEENRDIEEDFVLPPPPIVNTQKTRHDFSNYLTSLRTADELLGALLDEVDRLGLRENTVVIYTTDHGVSFPEMKCTLTDAGTGIALFIRHPQIGRGASDAMVSHVDIFPTVCDMLNLPHPDWLQGKSLLPLMKGETDKVNDYVFSEVTYHAAYEPQRGVRSNRMKYIRLFDEDTHKPLVNIGDHEAKDAYLTSKLPHLPRKREFLFDLVADPMERINLVDVPEYREEYEELSRVLHQWMVDTNDPLLRGPIPMEPGQIANRTSAVSPFEPCYDCDGNQVD